MIVKAIEKSDNRKVGPVSVTMAAQASCGRGCPFLGRGCYAESGPQGLLTLNLNRAAKATSHITIAQAEAAAIDRLTGRRPLRIHIVGDCKDNRAAQIVSCAAERHTKRFGQAAWTYTHSWAQVSRKSWGNVSVLASCDSSREVQRVHTRGYATALVVPEFLHSKAYMIGDSA
jgi:hypothetical protein